jgi:hypothetical protein
VIENEQVAAAPSGDLGEYCRRVEEHLGRVNEGNLIRVFGPAFELVRRWHQAAVPLSIVYRGIENKAERHRSGRSKRPLRLEFCESDVAALFDDWRRAVGLSGARIPTAAEGAAMSDPPERRPASLAKQIDRAVDRLAKVAGRLELPEDARELAARVIDELSHIREASRRTRGDARQALVDRAADADREISVIAKLAGAAWVRDAEQDALAELAPFRARLGAEDWQKSVEASVDRLLRDRIGLPTVELQIVE